MTIAIDWDVKHQTKQEKIFIVSEMLSFILHDLHIPEGTINLGFGINETNDLNR